MNPFVPPIGQLPEESFLIHQIPAQGLCRGYLILLPELWGIVPQIKAMAQRFSNEGFAVYIPDILPGTIAPTADPKIVRSRYAPADDIQAMKKIAYVAACIRRAEIQRGPVLVAGFCYGGRMALHAAAHVVVDGVLSFYGTFGMPSGTRALDPRISARYATVPVQAHYGGEDASIPPGDVADAARIIRYGQVFVYPGAGHAFMNETRESYRPAAAALAWTRVLDFLNERILAWSRKHKPNFACGG